MILDPPSTHQLKKKRCQSWTPSDNFFWIRACFLLLSNGQVRFGLRVVGCAEWKASKQLKYAYPQSMPHAKKKLSFSNNTFTILNCISLAFIILGVFLVDLQTLLLKFSIK